MYYWEVHRLLQQTAQHNISQYNLHTLYSITDLQVATMKSHTLIFLDHKTNLQLLSCGYNVGTHNKIKSDNCLF